MLESKDTGRIQLPKPAVSWKRSLLSLVMALLAAGLLHEIATVPREVTYMAGIFILAALLWVTDAMPLFATSLLVIGLQALLLANPGGWPGLGFESGTSPHYRSILNNAADPVLVLFFGGFILAQAAIKEGVDRAMSALLLRPFGTEPKRVLLGIMLVTLLFGMWMSNTATATMMLALLTPMLAQLPPGEPFRKALVMSVAFAANISGISTPIASPPNAVAMGFLQDSGYKVPFLGWMLVATPLAVGLTFFAWFLLLKFFPPKTAGLRINHESGKVSRRGWGVVGVFVLTVLLWMTDQWHGLPSALVALLPAIALTVTGIFSGKDLGKLEWRILILIAGGISLGTGMQATGLDKILVQWFHLDGGDGQILLITMVLGTLLVGTFMSNTAAANLFLPIGISSAIALGPDGGLHPVQIAMSIALAASMSMALPISTPPNALAHGRGEFSTLEMFKTAMLISGIAAMIIIMLGGPVMRFWGLLR